MRETVFIVLALFISGSVLGQGTCLVCKRKTVPISSLKDDHSKPSRNLSVWNRSICGNPSYGKGSTMCPHDFYAYDATMMKDWGLSIENKNGFTHPLVKGIFEFPTPSKGKVKSRVVYSQSFKTLKKVEHSVGFWFSTNDKYISKIKEYAKKHGIKVTIDRERMKGQSYVSAKKNVNAEQADAGPDGPNP